MRSNLILSLVLLVTMTPYVFGSDGNKPAQLWNEIEELCQQGKQAEDSSYQTAYAFYDLARKKLTEITAQNESSDIATKIKNGTLKVGGRWTETEFGVFLSGLQERADAEGSLFRCASYLASCVRSEFVSGSIYAEIVSGCCQAFQIDAAIDVIESIKDEDAKAEAFQAIDSITPNDRWRIESAGWGYSFPCSFQEDEHVRSSIRSFKLAFNNDQCNRLQKIAFSTSSPTDKIKALAKVAGLRHQLRERDAAEKLLDTAFALAKQPICSIDSSDNVLQSNPDRSSNNLLRIRKDALASSLQAVANGYAELGANAKAAEVYPQILRLSSEPEYSLVPIEVLPVLSSLMSIGASEMANDSEVKMDWLDWCLTTDLASIYFDTSDCRTAPVRANQIADCQWRGEALEQIACRCASMFPPDSQKAFLHRALEAYSEPKSDSRHISGNPYMNIIEVAELFAKLGFFDEAIETSNTISDASWRCSSLLEVADQMHAAGNEKESDDLFRLVESMNQSLAVSNSFVDPILELAEWHIRTGRLQIATIGLQESPNRSAARTSLLGRISQKYALRGMPDSALLVLQSIESSSDRMDEMFLTADTCAVNGEKEFAQQLLARALKSKVGEKAYLSSETIRVAVETSIAIGDESFVEVLDSLLVYGYDLAIALTEESDSLLVKNERDKGIRCLRATTKVTLSLGHDRFGDPWWDDNWRNVADLYIRVGYYPEVFGLLENPLISERTSLCAKILTDLGVAYSRKGLDLSDVEKGTLHRLIEHIVN